MLPRCGHVPQEERPAEVEEALSAFLDSLPE
jgi:pimeloyl-ACP methyl ester carboxylesterase